MVVSKYITKIFICGFLLLQITTLLHGQKHENPFDLPHRQKEKTIGPTVEKTDTHENPFDISKPRATAPIKPVIPEAAPTTENPFDKKVPTQGLTDTAVETHKSPPLPIKETKSKNDTSGFVFWVMLVLMIFLALEITLFKPLIQEVYRAFTNDNILRLLHREQKEIISFPFFLLYVFFFASFGIFAFLVADHYTLIPKTPAMLFYFISGTGTLFFLKHILLKIVEIIFPVQKEIKLYSFSLVIFSSILGLALVPFNIVVAFASEDLVKMALYGGLILIFLITVFCILRGLFLASKYLAFHKFHFFMYLCTVEIAPVVIIIKLLLIKAGIH